MLDGNGKTKIFPISKDGLKNINLCSKNDFMAQNALIEKTKNTPAAVRRQQKNTIRVERAIPKRIH